MSADVAGSQTRTTAMVAADKSAGYPVTWANHQGPGNQGSGLAWQAAPALSGTGGMQHQSPRSLGKGNGGSVALPDPIPVPPT